ncbi:MAG: c-type cytochrome, partial [Muribaculaceae bacterium]
TTNEIAGYELFKKYNCATCHVGEILGGKSYELIGVKANYFTDRKAKMTEEDNGRFKQTKIEHDRNRFKVPGLRNIELTAPYFHDGSMATMDDAVRAMAKYQLGLDLPQQEVDKIVAFLRTLTGEYKGTMLTNKNIKS